MLELYDYLKLAKYMLIAYGGNPNDEDAVSFVANKLMIADIKYDDTIGTIEGYRGMCGRYAVTSWHNHCSRKKNKKLVSLNAGSHNGYELIDNIQSDSLSPEDSAQVSEIINYANRILNDKQLQCFQMHFIDKMTMQDIGNSLGITKQGVSRIVKQAVNKLKKHVNAC